MIQFDGKSDSEPMLVMVTDHSWDKFKPLMRAMNFRKYVVEIFGINEFHLDLKRIDAKCLRFYFEVPSCFHELVLPLTPEQEECLWKYGIAKIQFRNLKLENIGIDFVVRSIVLHISTTLLISFPDVPSIITCTYIGVDNSRPYKNYNVCYFYVYSLAPRLSPLTCV